MTCGGGASEPYTPAMILTMFLSQVSYCAWYRMIGFATVPGAPTVPIDAPLVPPPPPSPPALPDALELDELALAFAFDVNANSLKCGVDNVTSQLFALTEDGVVIVIPVCTQILVDLFRV